MAKVFWLKKMGKLDKDGETLTLTLSGRKRSAIVVVSRDKSKKESDKQTGVKRSQERNVIKI